MKLLNEKSGDSYERLLALAEFLDAVPENEDDDPDWNLEDALEDLFSYEDRYAFTVEYGREEYLVLTDSEADDEARERAKQLFDDIGIPESLASNNTDDKAFFKDVASDQYDMIAGSPDSYTSFFDIGDVKEGVIDYINKKIADKAYIETIKKYSRAFLEIEEGEDYDYSFMDYDVGLDYISTDYSSFSDYLEDQGVDKWTDKALEDAFTGWFSSITQNVDYADDDDVINEAESMNIISDYIDDAVSNYLDQYISAWDYLEEIYGNDGAEISKALSNYIDEEGCIDDYIRDDGRGQIISGYDGNENEQGDYYIYRIN